MKDFFYEYYHDKNKNLSAQYAKNFYETPAHFHKVIEIVYLFDDNLKMIVDDETIFPGANDVVFVHNYKIHEFFLKGNEPNERFVLILPCDYTEETNKQTLPPLLNDKAFNERYIKPLFELLCFKKAELPPLVQKGYINVLMGYLVSHYLLVPVKRSDDIELMVSILRFIDENYAENLTLDSVSSHFGYNRYYFSRLFNLYIGENLSNYIHVVRLQHFLRRKKKDKTASIASLAMDCGFESVPTFYRCFKKIYKKSPKEYFAEV